MEKELPFEDALELNSWEHLTLGFLIGPTINEKGSWFFNGEKQFYDGSKACGIC